jgi:hypothetical protein
MSFRLNRPRQFSAPQSSSSDTGPLLKLIDELTKRINELEQKSCDCTIVDRITELEQKVNEPSVLPSVVERIDALEQQDIKVSLKDLTDVDLSNMTDDSTLSYDGATEKWTAVVYESDANAIEEE